MLIPRRLITATGVVALSLFAFDKANAGTDTLQIFFLGDRGPSGVERPAGSSSDSESTIEAAVNALLAGPTPQEAAAGLGTCLPEGVTLAGLTYQHGTVTADLSQDVLSNLDEASLRCIFDQFRHTLFGLDNVHEVRLTCQGLLLADYLPDAPALPATSELLEQTIPTSKEEAPPSDIEAATSLAGRIITIGPSHGRYYNGSGWYWQRSDPCGFGEAVLEDTNSIRLMQFLKQYLEQDGATVYVPRQMDETDCCHPATGLPWWKMAARYWLEHEGYPSNIWNSSGSHYSDDIRARPLFADYWESDIYISHHTNAGGGGTASGTEVFRDSAMEHPEHEADSYTLALLLKGSIESAIRDMYDPLWPNRNSGLPRDSAGGFGEIRIPDRPACLVELAFHDNCSKDAVYLTDDFFRSVSQWGLYKGVCDYFGVTPSWDQYSCEFVSDTIPNTMTAGESYPVSVTFRNRGVLWSDAEEFRLGAVGDSDPFAAFNRVNLSGTVRPGETFTFNFTLTAPATAGFHTTQWQMVRDGYAWFGPTLTKQIQVGNAATNLLADDFESYANQAAFEGVWQDTGNSEYSIDTGFGNPGQSVRMPSPSVSFAGRYYANLPGTYNGTDAEPLVLQYDLYLESSGAPDWSGARHYCELRGYSGGSFGQGNLIDLLATGLYSNSHDAFSTMKYQGRVINGGASDTQWYTLDAELTAPDRAAGWRTMRIETMTSIVNFYIDGVLAETVPRSFNGGFNCVVLGSDLTAGGHRVFVDNVEVLLYASLPTIDVQPISQEVCEGSQVQFEVQASGSGLSYQWQKDTVDLVDGTDVSGATSSLLTLSNASVSDSASYRCVVSNIAGQATSNPATLNVQAATAITQQPQPMSVLIGQPSSFSVTATGDGTITYRWQKDGVDLNNGGEISGVTTPSLQISDVRADNAGLYRCQVTAGCGTVYSQEAALGFSAPPPDVDNDGDVDAVDYGWFQRCYSGFTVPQTDPNCQDARLDSDEDVDASDFDRFAQCFGGANIAADPNCAN